MSEGVTEGKAKEDMGCNLDTKSYVTFFFVLNSFSMDDDKE